MVEQKIKSYLNAVFKLPIVANLSDTKVERAISFDIETIKISNKNNNRQDIILDVRIYFRCPNGYDSIGYLSQKIGKSYAGEDLSNFSVSSASASEEIVIKTSTEIVLSKKITIKLEANEDQIREKIKNIELTT